MFTVDFRNVSARSFVDRRSSSAAHRRPRVVVVIVGSVAVTRVDASMRGQYANALPLRVAMRVNEEASELEMESLLQDLQLSPSHDEPLAASASAQVASAVQQMFSAGPHDDALTNVGALHRVADSSRSSMSLAQKNALFFSVRSSSRLCRATSRSAWPAAPSGTSCATRRPARPWSDARSHLRRACQTWRRSPPGCACSRSPPLRRQSCRRA